MMEYFKATLKTKGKSKDKFCGIIKAENADIAKKTFKRHFGTNDLLIRRAFVTDGMIVTYRPKK